MASGAVPVVQFNQRLAFLLASLDSGDAAERSAFGARELLLRLDNGRQARAALHEVLKGAAGGRGYQRAAPGAAAQGRARRGPGGAERAARAPLLAAAPCSLRHAAARCCFPRLCAASRMCAAAHCTRKHRP